LAKLEEIELKIDCRNGTNTLGRKKLDKEEDN
jgi:hypothetical protein